MPTLHITTKESKEIWKSPDGQRIIHEVLLDYQGSLVKAKTYSRAIGAVGFIGDVESYEKPNSRGQSETFVKQPPKEGGYNEQSSGGGRPSKDEGAIQAMWAITKALEYLTLLPDKEAVDISLIQPLAVDFYNMVDKVKAGQAEQDNVPSIDNLEDIQTIKNIFGESDSE